MAEFEKLQSWRKTMSVYITFVVCLTGCSGRSEETSRAPARVVATSSNRHPHTDVATPAPDPTREVHRLDEVRRLRSDRVNAPQIAWLRTVAANPYWQKRLGYLYFSPMLLSPSRNTTPLIVFYMQPSERKLDPGTAYQIVGETCQSWFILDSLAAFPVPAPGGGAGPRCWRDPLGPDEKALTPLPVKRGDISPARLLKDIDAIPNKAPPKR